MGCGGRRLTLRRQRDEDVAEEAGAEEHRRGPGEGPQDHGRMVGKPDGSGCGLHRESTASQREGFPRWEGRYTGFRAISWRAMMMRCISLVPSPIIIKGASRYRRSMGYSLE